MSDQPKPTPEIFFNCDYYSNEKGVEAQQLWTLQQIDKHQVETQKLICVFGFAVCILLIVLIITK